MQNTFIMQSQNYKNHRRFVPGFHVLTFVLITAYLVGSIINLVHSDKSNLYSASLICLSAVIMGLLAYYLRTFPLKVQDRAIRAEENLRHFALSGKLLDRRLRLGQIIALRFAADEEFVALAKKAVEEDMSNAAIKKAISEWKGDHQRA